MRFARRQTNTTILADGSILVTNGSSGPGFNDFTSPVFDAELWKPATKSWSLMARENAGRTYHSTTLLLPDARVLSGGSGEGGGVDYANSQLTLQVFSPPYLYNADGTLASRPAITSAPSRLTYEQTLHGADAQRGVGDAGDAHPALVGDPRLQPEPAHLPADLQRPRGAARWRRRRRPTPIWRRRDRTCSSC